MWGFAAGFVLLGVFCGAVLHLMAFALVLVAAAGIAAIGTAVQGGSVLLHTVVAVIALQVGYALGIGGRALLRSREYRRRPRS